MKSTVEQSITEGKSWRVILDGLVVLYAQGFDDEVGVVRAPLLDDDGGPVFDHGRDDWALVERSGDVEWYELNHGRRSRPDFPKVVAAAIAGVSPFNVKLARDNELSPTWDRPRAA